MIRTLFTEARCYP